MVIGKKARLVVTLSILTTIGSLAYLYSDYRDNHPSYGNIPAHLQEFLRAVATGDISSADRLVKQDPDLLTAVWGPYGSALHLAASRNQPRMIEFLLDQGADINARGQWGGTPLHWACWLGSKDSAAVLINHGASVELRCMAFRSTPLLWCAHGSRNVSTPGADYVGTAKMLLENGADPDTTNNVGANALSMAAPAVAELMREYGAHDLPPATAPATQPADPGDDTRPTADAG
ncbi:MAG TPA: ankyrin repeat domain-containing protein [Tepidisphaeraceae bacterium]|jgi:ankyrin repeat protein